MADAIKFRRGGDGLSVTEHTIRWTGLAGVIVLAVLVIDWKPYSAHVGLGYVLGIVGVALMLPLFGYPLRKRFRFLGSAGPLRHWFRLHMICGVLGPLFILFHALFNVESVNAMVALSCMLLVAISGLIGRFLYRGIHYGLYGRRASAGDTRKSFELSMADVSPRMQNLSDLEQLLQAFVDWVEHPPPRSLPRIYHFLSIGWRRRLTVRRARRQIRKMKKNAMANASLDGQGTSDMDGLMVAFSRTCVAQQRAAQYLVFERLFALWHVIHLPFVYVFLLAAITHVVAVHVY